MGIINHLLIAHQAEGETVIASEDPSGKWEGFYFRGLDKIKLAALWLLMEAGERENTLDELIEAIQTISNESQTRWIDILPPAMLSALVSIAGMEDEEVEALEARWFQVEEFKGWDKSEIEGLTRTIGDLAETAELEGKTIMVYTR